LNDEIFTMIKLYHHTISNIFTIITVLEIPTKKGRAPLKIYRVVPQTNREFMTSG